METFESKGFPDLIDEACVYAVGDRYQIIFHTRRKGAAYVRIGEDTFYDAMGGCVNTEKTVHSVTVPMALLDRACRYTVGYFHVALRRAYEFDCEEKQEKTYTFRPVRAGAPLRCVMLADAHGALELPAKMASACGEYGLVIMNGDIPNRCEEPEDLLHIPRLAAMVSHGEIPVLNARGNHDTRGACAPDYGLHVGTQNGSHYYTCRLGDIFFILLDCGEDKPDCHQEYGGLADYEQYRRAQIAFLDRVLECPELDECSHVAVVVHTNPHIHYDRPVCAEWLARISAIKPDVMLCAHTHDCGIDLPCEEARDGYPPITFPTVTGSAPRGVKGTMDAGKPPSFTGALIVFDEHGTDAYFIDDQGCEHGHAHFDVRAD